MSIVGIEKGELIVHAHTVLNDPVGQITLAQWLMKNDLVGMLYIADGRECFDIVGKIPAGMKDDLAAKMEECPFIADWSVNE